jgi:O-methyltransferase domain
VSVTAGNPGDVVRGMITAGHLARVIQIAVRLGIPDLVADGGRTTPQLAAAAGTHSEALERMLRVLAAHDLCAKRERGTWGLTTLGETLRSDSPTACHRAALYWGLDSVRAAWDRLDDSLRTGLPAFSRANGRAFFQHMEGSGEDGRVFDEFMTANQRERAAPHADSIDCRNLRTVVDVGGGEGAFLIELAQRNQHLSGTVLELPHVAARARQKVTQEQLADRITVSEGSFFTTIPRGADAYVLSAILHDWPDEQALTILQACRAAMTDDAVLLIIEQVVDSGEITSRFSALLDMAMLVLLGGKERSREEFGSLLAAADMEICAVTPTPTTFSIVMARPAHRAPQSRKAPILKNT